MSKSESQSACIIRLARSGNNIQMQWSNQGLSVGEILLGIELIKVGLVKPQQNSQGASTPNVQPKRF